MSEILTNENIAEIRAERPGDPQFRYEIQIRELCDSHDAQEAEIATLKADASTVAHLRSVSARIAEGKGAGAHLSDSQVAGWVRMLDRHQVDHEAVCVMGRERIIALSDEVNRLTKAIEAASLFLSQPFAIEQMEHIVGLFISETGRNPNNHGGTLEPWILRKQDEAGEILRAALAAGPNG